MGLIHDRAMVDGAVGEGTYVWANAHVLEGAVVGRDCNICEGVFVESGVTIGDRVTLKNHALLYDGVRICDDVFIGPGVVFTNDIYPRSLRGRDRSHLRYVPTVVEQGASIGANATIVCGVTIGAHSMVGAGAVVTRDVPPGMLVVGNPARVIGAAAE